MVLSLWKRWFLYILIAILSMINTSLNTPLRLTYQGRDSTFSGTVIREEHREFYVKLLINIDEAIINNRIINYKIPVEFYTREHKTYLGRKLLIKGRIKNSKFANHPNLLSGNIIETDPRNTFLGGVLFSVRGYIDSMLKSLLMNEHYDLGTGLILGGSGRLKKDLKNVFVRAGVLHILAVSGLHVGFVCMFVGFILIFIPISARIKFFIIMLVLCLYTGITGFRPGVCRATLMAFLFGLSLILQRNVDGVHIINITAIIFLLINPLLVFDIGAQLSFSAVYGILFLYPIIQNSIIKRIHVKLYKFIMTSMAVSFSAQLFVSPLLIYYFHRLPTLAVISNLIIVPIASITIFLLFFCLIIGTFSFMLAKMIAVLISILLSILIIISKLFAGIPFSTVTLYVSPIILLLLYFIYSRRLRKLATFSIIIISIFFSISSLSDCVIIKTGTAGTLISTTCGEKIFVTSRRSKVQTAVFLANQNIENLDYLIATENHYPVEKKFFELPDKLHVKRIKFGKMTINVSDNINIIFREKKITLDNSDFKHYGNEENLLYILTDGKNVQRFDTPLHGSIIDQIILDIKVAIAKLRFLF